MPLLVYKPNEPNERDHIMRMYFFALLRHLANQIYMLLRKKVIVQDDICTHHTVLLLFRFIDSEKKNLHLKDLQHCIHSPFSIHNFFNVHFQHTVR